MGERPDDVRRGLRASSGHETDPLADPAGTSEEARLVTGADSALGSGVGGGAVIDEGEARRARIERTRADMGRRLRTPRDSADT
jgi:hypothetical protein